MTTGAINDAPLILLQTNITSGNQNRMKQSNYHTLNIAHRGARSLAPENTLAAAQKALEIGADMWELDVGLTADGELILMHDNTLERISNVADRFPARQNWWAYQFTLAELRQLDFGSWFNQTDPFGQIAAGNVSPTDLNRYVGQPIPTLCEALTFTRDQDWRVNVEIKDWSNTPIDANIVEKVVDLIEKMDMSDQVLVSSFNYNYLERVKAANPKIATGVLVYQTHLPDPVALLRRLGAQAYTPHLPLIQSAAIADLREQGFEVYIWTVNDEETMRTLIQAGASGIITDFPQILKPILDARR